MAWHDMVASSAGPPRTTKRQGEEEGERKEKEEGEGERSRSKNGGGYQRQCPQRLSPGIDIILWGLCVCMHRTQACMYVSTATDMFLNWRRKREEGEKNGDLLVPGWRFCPARGHEGGGEVE